MSEPVKIYLYRRVANEGCRIYKPKYLDDPSPDGKEKKRSDTVTSTKELGKKEEAAKPGGRSRARSIWSRKKDKA